MANPSNRVAVQTDSEGKKFIAQWFGFTVNFCTVFALIVTLALLLFINMNGNASGGLAQTSASLSQICQMFDTQNQAAVPVSPSTSDDGLNSPALDASMLIHLNELPNR